MKKKRVIAVAAAAVLSLSMLPNQVFGYGETTSPSTLFTDTNGVGDYTTWKNSIWTGLESIDTSKIVLTPGATEKDLNFAWYSISSGKPAVKVAKNPDLSDGVIYTGTAASINRSNGTNTYTASNKVTIEGKFQENTTYYYSYTDDVTSSVPAWSTPKTYKTKSASSFQTILVGDPQVGASGSSGQGTSDDINIAVDTYNWNKTTLQAAEAAPNASFIISVGDQIDYSTDNAVIRESEYAGFLYPDLLRNLPLATAIGNHESKVEDYSYHYNNPNSTDNLGSTNSGSDYYYSYGDVLFISLNSNNRNSAEHEALLKKAVESHQDAKWKVVYFHHDIYGSGEPHSDTDGANLRTIFAPLMDKFDIDICLTGHDHSYARSYQMLDGTAIEYGSGQAVDPEGTLYIAAGSASGSKFYNLASTKQYYIAERTNAQLPTFSTIDFTGSSLTIKTYDYNGNKYADDFTLVKNADKDSVLNILSEIDNLNSEEYTQTTWNNLQSSAAAVKNLLQLSGEDTGAQTLSQVYDKTLNTDNPADPLNYYGYAQGTYKDSVNASRLTAGFSALLDKTITTQVKIDSLDYTQASALLLESIENLTKVSNPEPTKDGIEPVKNAPGTQNAATVKAAKTGDSSNTGVLASVMAVSLGAGAITLFKRKKA